jgi:hypothetical protein
MMLVANFENDLVNLENQNQNQWLLALAVSDFLTRDTQSAF